MIATRTPSPPLSSGCDVRNDSSSLRAAHPVELTRRVCGPTAAKTSLDRVMHLGGERHPVRHAQLGEHVPEVGVHGVRRDVQAPGHGAVGQSLGHEQRHRPLGRGEALPAGRRPVPRPAPARTDAEGPQLRPDPARPRVGARSLVALQCLGQQRRGLVASARPGPAASPRPRRRRCARRAAAPRGRPRPPRSSVRRRRRPVPGIAAPRCAPSAPPAPARLLPRRCWPPRPRRHDGRAPGPGAPGRGRGSGGSSGRPVAASNRQHRSNTSYAPCWSPSASFSPATANATTPAL